MLILVGANRSTDGLTNDSNFRQTTTAAIRFYNNLCFQGQSIDDIPSAVIEDAAQLVKANSITGNKMNNVDVVYTMWNNLKKTPAMDVGQVSFHRDKDVKKIRVEKRINETVNRLNKTKIESHPGTCDPFSIQHQCLITSFFVFFLIFKLKCL